MRKYHASALSCLLRWIILAIIQSTPPYGGRHQMGIRWPPLHGVSIHAPVWGATRYKPEKPKTDIVSIHAPVWGATERNLFLVVGHRVSIHAPVWGATTFSTYPVPHPLGFNPRPRMGGDLWNCGIFLSVWFQSTPPYGGRQNYPGSVLER